MVKVDLEALKEQASSAKEASKEARSILKDYQKVITQFQSDDELKGKAYQAAKEYCDGPLTVLLKGADAFYKEAGLVLGALADQYEAKVDSKSWDSEELDRLIHQANQIISHEEHMISQLRQHKKRQVGVYAHERIIDLFQEMKYEFELILQHLEEFSNESISWFSQLQSIQSSLNSAISNLSKSLHISSGVIDIPKNQDWEKALRDFDIKLENFKLKNKIESLPQKDQQIIRDFEKTYNLDTQSAYSLYKLQQGILLKAKKEDWDNKKIIFEYNRLLASCSYIVIPLKKDSKKLDDFKLTNNSTYVATRWQALCQTEDWETTKKLLQQYGLSLFEINHLKKSISVQHALAGKKNKLDLSHEAVQLACFTEQPSENRWRVFLHRLSHVINRGLEHEEISYKGDIDSGRLDSADIFSDIDAINMYHKMTKTSSQNVFNVSSRYHQDVRSGKINRVDEFYENNSFGTNNKTDGKRNVEKIIRTSTPGSAWIRGTETTNKEARNKSKQTYDNNTKDFWDILNKEEKNEKR